MKRLIISLYIIFGLVSCTQQKQPVYKHTVDENKYWDSLCLAETRKAELDIAQGRLTYFHVFGMVETFRSNEEMNELLSKYNIGNDEYGYLCMAPPDKQHCYSYRMRKEIDHRYGINFIDSLREKAEINYVQKNIDKIFSFEECDRKSRYPEAKNYEDSFNKYEEDFFINFEYPEDYVYRKENDSYYSYMSVEFILYRNGSISDLKTQIRFQKNENYKYSNYFMKSVEEFVKNVKWNPATTKGIVVNSEMDLYFKLK